MVKYGSMALIAPLFLLAVAGLLGLVAMKSTADSSILLPDNHEQVKVFVQATGNEEGAKKLEDTLNKWLKENAGKVEIVARTQGGTQFVTVVTIWYKELRR